jgi:hypothetical protein
MTQDRCTVCVERTRGSVIVLDASDGSTRSQGSCGISFRSVRRQCYYQCKIGAWFALNIPQAQKSFLAHPIVLLGDVGQVKSYFGPFGDSARVDAR